MLISINGLLYSLWLKWYLAGQIREVDHILEVCYHWSLLVELLLFPQLTDKLIIIIIVLHYYSSS